MTNKWTTEYPTQPGYYWLRNWDKVDPEPRTVEMARSGLFYQIGDEMPYGSSDASGAEWLGPIQPPENL